MSIAYEFENYASAPSWEAEAFMESVAEAARTGRRYRPLALAAMAAARAALSQGRVPDVESELEATAEAEWEITVRQPFNAAEAAPSAALMEHFGHAAAEAESNGEAFAFLAPLLPLAMKALPIAAKVGAKLLPKVASTVAKVAPKVMKGVNAAAKALRTNPATRQLVQALPQVVRRTTVDIAKQVAQGRPVSPQTAVRSLARNTARVLGDPRAAMQTLQRARALDRRVDDAVAGSVSSDAPRPCMCQ